jgi:rhodanese-related sulfurtransferase
MGHHKVTRTANRHSLSWFWIGAAIVVAGLGMGALVWWQIGTADSGSSPMAATVSVAEAARLRDAGAFLLDVREPAEWASFHLAGATLIPLGSLPARLNEVPRGKPVVVVCLSGHRSLQGRDILLQAGFTQVTTLAGGLLAWQGQGQPMITGP